MIEFTQGNLLDANAEALVNTVNTDGVMGKGIALQFKRAFPSTFLAYEREAKAGRLATGKVLIDEVRGLHGPRFIIHFPTKRHWRNPSKLSYIDEGLVSLIAEVRRLGIRSIAVPPLGCGNGGLASPTAPRTRWTTPASSPSKASANRRVPQLLAPRRPSLCLDPLPRVPQSPSR